MTEWIGGLVGGTDFTEQLLSSMHLKMPDSNLDLRHLVQFNWLSQSAYELILRNAVGEYSPILFYALQIINDKGTKVDLSIK